MREIVTMGEWPQMPPANVAHQVGRAAAAWLERRARPETARTLPATVKFTPHTAEERSAWRARKGGGR